MISVTEHWMWRFSLFTLTKWIMPPTISFDGKEVRIRRFAWFGISSTDERIKLDRIASVRIASSIMTSTVVIETMGGAQADFRMTRLPKKEAQRFVERVNAAL